MYRLIDGIRSTWNQDGTVLDIQNGRIISLNLTGALLVDKLQHRLTESQIARDIGERFGISLKTALHDLAEFLKSLEQQHLLL